MGGIINSAGIGAGLTSVGNQLMSYAGNAMLLKIREESEENKLKLAQEFAKENEAARHTNEMARDKARAEQAPLTAKAVAQAEIDTKLDPSNLSRQQEADRAERKAKGDDAIQAEIAAGTNPKLLQARKNMALASHIVDEKVSTVPSGDGRFLRLDGKGNPLGYLKDPETGKDFVSKKNISESQLAIAKSYLDEGVKLYESGNKEEGATKMELGRKFLSGDQAEAPKGGFDPNKYAKGEKPAPGRTAPPPAKSGVINSRQSPRSADFDQLSSQAESLDGAIKRATQKFNSAYGQAPGNREVVQSELVELARKRNAVQAQIDALRK